MLAHDLQSLIMATVTCPGGARAVVEAVCRSGRHYCTADLVAQALQLPNRYHVIRELRIAGLPSFKVLSQWIRLIAVVAICEREQISPSKLALRDGRNPDIYTKLARRVTGLSWDSVRRNGSAWAIIELSRVCSNAQRETLGTTREPAEGAARRGA